MMTNSVLPLAMPMAAGFLLGAVFFVGLWWTVQRGTRSRRPGLLFFSSLLVRVSMTVMGFCLVAADEWRRWLACSLGFLLARYLIQWRLRSMETAHAP
jgi:F1F0 ATPase subunit 2